MKKAALIISHLLYWIFTILTIPNLFTIVWVLASRPDNVGPNEAYHVESDYPGTLIVAAAGACIFYACYFSLHLFVKRPARFLWIIAFYVIYTLVMSLPASLTSYSAAVVLGPIFYFNTTGFSFRAYVEWLKDRRIRAELEKERLSGQLELLKSKIDPHFLFNNLNNIDVFIQEEPRLASEYLKKLSDILRFMLYEAGQEKIPLNSEIAYIRKYIDLQKIRTSNTSFVKLEITGEPAGKRIAPMLLIHFIENAFKHASNKKVENAVAVRLDISSQRLNFYCRNHVSPAKEAFPARNGMGIQLLRQKLDLLYKKDHVFRTKEEDNWYIVTLDIPLDEDQLHHR